MTRSGMRCCSREAAAAAADTWLKYDPAINHRLHLTPIDLLSAMIQTRHNVSLPVFLFIRPRRSHQHLCVAPRAKAFKITVQVSHSTSYRCASVALRTAALQI